MNNDELYDSSYSVDLVSEIHRLRNLIDDLKTGKSSKKLHFTLDYTVSIRDLTSEALDESINELLKHPSIYALSDAYVSDIIVPQIEVEVIDGQDKPKVTNNQQDTVSNNYITW